MSRLLSRQGQATVRSLGVSTNGMTSRAASRTGLLGSRQSIRCYTGEKQDGSSFKGQMLESVSSRIARERQERARFAAQRHDSAGSKAWGVTFSMSHLHPLVELTLDMCF